MQKILIAEDEHPLAAALKLKLTNSGYEVTTVENGEQAIAAIEKDKFDLLLLDLIMPVKDGFYVLEELKKQNNTIPAIVISNLSQQEDAERAKALGAREFLIKSDTPLTDIVEKVKAILS